MVKGLDLLHFKDDNEVSESENEEEGNKEVRDIDTREPENVEEGQNIIGDIDSVLNNLEVVDNCFDTL